MQILIQGFQADLFSINDKFHSSYYSYFDCRSNRSQVFYKMSFLRNFTKFTGKHYDTADRGSGKKDSIVQRCSLKKVFLKISENSQENNFRPRPATLLKKRLWHSCFPVNFAKFSKHLF